MTDEEQAIEEKPKPSPCSLRQACGRKGLDLGGARCPICPLRSLCQSELRWLVRNEGQWYRR